jgi:hypothetical protein
VLDGGHESSPWEGIGPLAQGMGVRNKVGDVQRRSGATQPMLEIVHKAHRKLAS